MFPTSARARWRANSDMVPTQQQQRQGNTVPNSATSRCEAVGGA
eukprot:CAMPEP_0203889314 /NCGR_PEP_ID=MMETSP0359-20131031/32880_1 /ASSEMBLY_ACC=CAM_ASM_000338 /TAXON_ID=268821 /ORGANISM="Scrippsiella Hangoei, Strain SHTV-5" /LENGTH=43 /DNA_ID= /DNA_START= /DNA_END= /DNA_ORIENTATION=